MKMSAAATQLESNVRPISAATTPTPTRRPRQKPIRLDDHQQFLDLADKYARQELHSLAEKMDEDESWPDDLFKKLGSDGYLGITIPEEYGGAGADLFTSGLVLQAMSFDGRPDAALIVTFEANRRSVEGDTFTETQTYAAGFETHMRGGFFPQAQQEWCQRRPESP